jgi:hypothetical protein
MGILVGIAKRLALTVTAMTIVLVFGVMLFLFNTVVALIVDQFAGGVRPNINSTLTIFSGDRDG